MDKRHPSGDRAIQSPRRRIISGPIPPPVLLPVLKLCPTFALQLSDYVYRCLPARPGPQWLQPGMFPLIPVQDFLDWPRCRSLPSSPPIISLSSAQERGMPPVNRIANNEMSHCFSPSAESLSLIFAVKPTTQDLLCFRQMATHDFNLLPQQRWQVCTVCPGGFFREQDHSDISVLFDEF